MTGASGFVGSRLGPALEEAGHEVRAMTRQPDRYAGAGTPIAGDVGDEASLHSALEGCDAAYYLVHSLDAADFQDRDAAAARSFARAAAAAGTRVVAATSHINLGFGLGPADLAEARAGDDSDDLSAHLRSRRQVERLLGETGVPVTVLRAGIVVGHGGVSWEMTRQLVAHLPAMVTPRWVHTRTQPIAVADVVRYLVGVLEAPEAEGRVFEVGGPEVLEYLEMLTRWLSLVTDVDVQTGRSLIDSMSNEVVVRDDAVRRVVPFDPMSYDEAVLTALGERAQGRREARAGRSPRRIGRLVG